jgi:hypothetical protein
MLGALINLSLCIRWVRLAVIRSNPDSPSRVTVERPITGNYNLGDLSGSRTKVFTKTLSPTCISQLRARK